MGLEDGKKGCGNAELADACGGGLQGQKQFDLRPAKQEEGRHTPTKQGDSVCNPRPEAELLRLEDHSLESSLHCRIVRS